MQVTSYVASASIGVLNSAQSVAPRDPAALIAADVALDRAGDRAVSMPRAEGGQGRGHDHHQHHRDRSADEGERSHHRMNRLGRALSRVMAGQETVSASANVLVAGPATSQTGVTVSIRAERVYGLYTDMSAGQGPWSHGADAAWADTVSITADRVENVFTAGGTDAVTIMAGKVDGVSTGNDADSLAIVADVVRNILTDEQDPFSDGDAADAVAIAARLVERVATGGGDDAIAILGGTVADIFAQDGNDALSIAAQLVGTISGGAGDDAISVDAVIGRRLPDEDLDAPAALSVAANVLMADTSGLSDAAANDPLDPATDLTVQARMESAVSWGAHVDGGAGNDAIAVNIGATIGISGGTGDDAIVAQGGTVGLFYALGDGNDTVALGVGTEAVVQLADDIGPFSIEMGDDTMTLTFGEGSITFSGLSSSGAIGLRQGSGAMMLLHPGVAGALDLTV